MAHYHTDSCLIQIAKNANNKRLTLFVPDVIIVSVWVVIGLSYGLLGRPLDGPPVQKEFLPSCHHTFGCQMLGPLGSTTEFLGIWFLIGQHTKNRTHTIGLSCEAEKNKYKSEIAKPSKCYGISFGLPQNPMMK